MLFFSSFFLFGQEKVDSLRAAINLAGNQEKASLQLQLVEQIRMVNSKEAFDLVEEVQKASEKSGWLSLFQESSYLLAELHFIENNYKRAARAGETAREAAQALGNELKELTALNLLQEIYTADKRTRKLEEISDDYAVLKSKLELEVKDRALTDLEKDYEVTSSEMKDIVKKLDRTELENRFLEDEKVRLENITLRLKSDSIENAMTLMEEENKVLQLNARAKRQQNLLLFSGLSLLFVLVISFIWIRSVREKRKQEAAQAILKQQLLQKEKMAALGAMTAGVAHEIKNPLNFVNNFADGSIDLLEELKGYLDDHIEGKVDQLTMKEIHYLMGELAQNALEINSQGRRADEIINSMMDHAQGETGTSSLANINSLVMESWTLAYTGQNAERPVLEVEIKQQLAKNLPEIRLVPQNINRAFLNIFSNSLEAFAERRITNPTISVTTKAKENQIEIVIRDNAGGIPKDLQKKVFNPFFTTKPTGRGNTGLGLSISHDIIEKGHDGSLVLYSDGKTFTQFVIKLPLVTH